MILFGYFEHLRVQVPPPAPFVPESLFCDSGHFFAIKQYNLYKVLFSFICKIEHQRKKTRASPQF